MSNAPVESKKRVSLPSSSQTRFAFIKAIGVRLVLGLFFISALMVLLISVVVNVQMNQYERMITESLQNHLMAAAQALATLTGTEELDRYHTVEDTNTPEYQNIRERLISFAEEYNVLYAYYWRDYGNDTLQYIVDNDMDPETQVGPDSIYEVEEIALNALAGNVGVTDLGSYTPTWDGLITGYAPVYDSDGNFYCVAGVDISDEYIFIQRRNSQNMTILQIIALLVSLVFGVLNMMLYRRKARQIEEAHIKLQYFNNNLRRAFSTYLSEDVVEEIVSDPTRLQLGGVKRHMTALFTDIKSFSGIAEALPPEQVVDLLNYYLSTMSDAILEQKGTIDKYEGDAIIAFFGAPLELPDHALRACLTAIVMRRLEADLNRYFAEKEISPSPLLTRIGINSGDMVVGNMGTQKKMNYTIISNAVNLASRLEGINKHYGTWILASENTINETEGLLLTRKLDRIRVVGINEPVRIYEILETKADATPAMHELTALFHNALGLFEFGRWKDAESAFSHVLKTTPNDGPSLLYLERCRQYQEQPPSSDWDQVVNFTEK
ncbi:MAG: adenylate/guanylate cyclase domain-containing protein [Treponema sp.]|jgi:class 3 adenylate cyclase|nr:adenylate/guanylate cyclase domain-containing protein [Treponema sp.]